MSMTKSQELQIKRWMKSIGETDEAMINEYLDKCRESPDALEYFIGRSHELEQDSVRSARNRSMADIKSKLS